MLLSNLIFTVLALAIPSALAAPIPVSFDSISEGTQTLVRRATPAPVGSEITLNGVKFKLESAVGNNGRTAKFRTKFNGVAAFAKQNINEPGFAKEIESTKKASDALHSGLYLASGTASGSQWLVVKMLSGKPFSTLVNEKNLKDKATVVSKATNTVVQAQKTLATGAKLIQADRNNNNVLFTEDLGKVAIVDFSSTTPVSGWTAQLEASQKKDWEALFDKLFGKSPAPKKSP